MEIIKSFNLSQMGVNTHIIKVEDDIILIDAPADIKQVIDYLNQNALILSKLLLTHYHFDHILGIDELKENFKNLEIYINKNEAKDLFNPHYTLAENYNITYHKKHPVKSLEELDLKGLKMFTISGHSPHSTVYLFDDKHAFVGDTLFKDSIGRTDLLYGDQLSLVTGIKKYLMTLDPETKIYPGHGENTNIKYENQYNIYLK